MWNSIGTIVMGRRLFDLVDGWEGHPPAGEHVVVVSHRPKPEGWHPEASYHFVDDVAAAIAKARELAGERTLIDVAPLLVVVLRKVAARSASMTCRHDDVVESTGSTRIPRESAMKLRTLAIASISTAALGVASVAAPAQAQDGNRQCVIDVSTPDTRVSCYDTFTEAVARATGGRVTDAPDNARAAAKDARFEARIDALGTDPAAARRTAAGDVLIAIWFRDADFGGGSGVVTTNGPCTVPALDPPDFTHEYVGDNWNDDIGSYKAFSGCRLKLFSDRGFQGASIDFAGTRTDLGVLDDEVSSILYS